MSNARVRLPPEIERIHLFQLEDCIIQANLGERDQNMIRMYLIDRIPQIEIAEDLGISRTTVSKRIKNAVGKIAVINQRLYKK